MHQVLPQRVQALAELFLLAGQLGALADQGGDSKVGHAAMVESRPTSGDLAEGAFAP